MCRILCSSLVEDQARAEAAWAAAHDAHAVVGRQQFVRSAKATHELTYWLWGIVLWTCATITAMLFYTAGLSRMAYLSPYFALVPCMAVRAVVYVAEMRTAYEEARRTFPLWNERAAKAADRGAA